MLEKIKQKLDLKNVLTKFPITLIVIWIMTLLIAIFMEDLSDLEIELLALGMVDAWVTPMLNSTELTLQFLGGKEEKFYSQSQHLAELRTIKKENSLEMNRLHNYYTYTNNSYFD